ncbi:tape measure protein [Stutzerimonas sp. NM35]
MSQESRLSIVLETRSAEQQARDLAKALEALERVGLGASGSAGSAGKSFVGTGRDAATGARGVDQMNSSLSSTDKAANTAMVSLKRLFATATAGIGAMSVVGAADTWSDLTSRVRLSIGAHQDVTAVMSRLSDIARGTYSSLESTAEAFAQNSVTLRALGKSTLEQLNYTEALNNALVVSGAKGERAQMVQNSLSRAMAEGALRGEDLNNVLNSGSRVAEALAEELGTDITQLRRLAAEGKITGEVVFTALTKINETLKDEAAKMPATIADGFLLMRNAALQSIGVFDQQAKVSEEMAASLVSVSDAIRDTDWSPYIKTVGVAAAGAIALYTARMGVATIATLAQGKASLSASMQQAVLTAQVNGTSVAAARATVAMRALNLAMGPAGWIGLAASAAAGLYLFSDGADAATESVDLLAQSSEEAAKAIKDLSSIQAQKALDDLTLNSGGIGQVWGSLLGGGSGSSSGGGGMNWGSLVDIGKNIYSVYDALTGVGSAMYTGYQSGGLTGALGGGANYYGSMLSNAYSTIAQWFGGTATSAATTAATEAALAAAAKGTAGYMLDVTTGQIVNTATTAGANAVAGGAGSGGVLSSISGMLSNPYTWAIAGMIASYKLYGQGVKADGSEVRDTFKESGSSGAADVLGDVLGGASSAIRLMDKALTHIFVDPLNLFGDAADKFTAVITGSPVTQAVNLALARLFGGGEKYKRTVGSAQGTYSAGEYTGLGAVESMYSGSKRFGDDFDRSLHDLNEAFSSSLGGLFEMFDIDSDIMTTAEARLRRTSGKLAATFTASFDDQTITLMEQYGKKARIEQSMQAWFDDVMGRGLSQAIGQSQLPEYLKELTAGLTKAAEVSEAVGGLFARFDGVNTTIETLNFRVFEMTDAGLRGADALLDLSAAIAGLEDPTAADKIASLTSLTSTYYDQFFTDAEKAAHTLDAVARAFEGADIVLAESRGAYRAMVEDIDLTTEAGREMFATLMALSGQAATYYSTLERQLMGAVDASFAALQQAVDAERKSLQGAHAEHVSALNASAASAASSISALTAISGNLDAALKRLRGTSDDSVRALRAQAVMTLNSALVQARGGESLAGVDGLQDALDIATQMDKSTYATMQDFEREQGRTANLIAELEAVNGKQLTVEQRLLQAANDQIRQAQVQFDSEMSRLDSHLSFAQQQLNALNGVDASIKTVEQAVKGLNISIVNALPASPAGGGGIPSPSQGGTLLDTIYQSVLGREADDAGMSYWQDQLASGAVSVGGLADAIREAAIQAGEVPAFASGGYTGPGGKWEPAGIVHKGEVVWSQADVARWGGAGLVDSMRQSGPELEVTGPSRIYSAGQTAAMLNGGGESAAEVRAMRRELAGVRDDLRQIAKNTMDTRSEVRQQTATMVILESEKQVVNG